MTEAESLQMHILPEHTRKALAAIPQCDLPITFEAFNADPALLRPYAGVENGLVLLRLFLEWLPVLKAQYDAAGIPDAVFRDNLKDFSIWTEDHWTRYHKPGFAEWEWVANTLRMKIFRLGRLQFEPGVLSTPVTCGSQVYPAGTPILDVHIPAGAPLDDAAVEAALQAAPIFFRTYFHQQFSLFHCHSWLLSPQLNSLLPPQSRILRFQNRFSVYAEDRERQAEERVFGFLSDDPALYPERTSLQRTLKKAISSGMTVGMGKGVLVIP